MNTIVNNESLEIRELVQSRPDGTSAVQIYSPSKLAYITNIFIVNHTGSAVDVSIYLDKNGTTYDANTIRYIENVAAKTTVVISDIRIPITSDGNLAVQVSTADAVTFTFDGMEKF